MNVQADQEWRAKARLTAAPGTVSAEAQTFLEAMAAMPRPPRPALDDHDGWVKMATASEALFAPRAEAMLAKAACRMETREMGGVPVHVATPPGMDARAAKRAYIYIHGGAFVFGGGKWPAANAAAAADCIGCTVYSVEYRMAPQHLFPRAPEDCLAVYRAVMERHEPAATAIGGSSAGGNLALVTALMARDRGLPLPTGLVLLTPEVDLTESGDTFQTHENIDVVLQRRLMDCNLLYAGGHALTDPYLSPLFAEYTSDFPRVFIQSGTRDLFLSNCALLHRKMLKAGIEAELHVWEAMPHGGFGGSAPEDIEVDEAIGAFLNRCWRG
jgi:acetyl esterase/lipase